MKSFEELQSRSRRVQVRLNLKRAISHLAPSPECHKEEGVRC
jgi:hypothetical protein